MEAFVSYSRRTVLAKLLAGSLAFVAAGLWFVGAFGLVHLTSRFGTPLSPEASAIRGLQMGVPAIAFFGLCAIVILSLLLGPRIVVRVDATGILWTRWSPKTIRWGDITEITAAGAGRQRCVNIKLRDPAMYPGRGLLGLLANANRGLTGADISIIMSAMDRNIDEVMEAVSRFRPAPAEFAKAFGSRRSFSRPDAARR